MRIVSSGREQRRRRPRRRGTAAALAVLLAAVCTLVGASAATASAPAPAPGGPLSTTERAFVRAVGAAAIANQEALSQFRTWVMARPGFAGSGYVGTMDDLQHKAVTVMWYGPRTTLLSAIVDEGARRGIPVTVQPRRHSLAQLDAAVAAVWRQSRSGGWAGFTVSTIEAVGPVDDGLTVNGTYTATPQIRRAPQVRALATTVLGVPVHVVPGVRAGDASGRTNDYPPFDAGGFMISPSRGTGCSSGFGIVLNGVSRITTALHCDAPDYKSAAAPHSSYGQTVASSREGDGRVLAGDAAALALDGPYNSDNFTKKVIGYQNIGLNDYVCTGGGNSGEHCLIKVTNLMDSFTDQYGMMPAIQAKQQTNDIAVTVGDSGGPVISLTNTDSTQVRAVGMIQGYEDPLMTDPQCGAANAHAVNGNVCSKVVVFTLMQKIVNSITGATLETTS